MDTGIGADEFEHEHEHDYGYDHDYDYGYEGGDRVPVSFMGRHRR